MNGKMNGRSMKCVGVRCNEVQSLADAVASHASLIVGVGSLPLLVDPRRHARLDRSREKEMAHLSQPMMVE